MAGYFNNAQVLTMTSVSSLSICFTQIRNNFSLLQGINEYDA